MTSGKQRSSKKLIIFDLDGTLIELPIDYDSLKQELSKKINKQFQNIFPTIRVLDSERKNRAFKIIDKYEYDALAKLKIKAGAQDIIKDLNRKGIQIAIVTMQGQVASEIIKNLAILNMVSSIITRENSLERKEQISIVLDKYGFSSSETIMVGDKRDDYNSAIELGIESYLVKKIDDIPYYTLVDLRNNLSQILG